MGDCIPAPAYANPDPIVHVILDALWAIMNDDRIKHWVEHGYGSSSPDVIGALDMYVIDAENLAKKIRSLI